jgi:methionine-gamma-lyase
MRKRGLSTRAIHPPKPPPVEGGEPAGPPIVPSTTFVFDTAARFGRVMEEDEHGYLYSRIRNPTVDAVQALVADLEGAEAALGCASGMGAISAALISSLEPGDTLLCARQLYGTTYSLVEREIRKLGVEVVYADVEDPAAWDRPAAVRYVETLANPGFPLADLAGIAAAKADGILVVDNTFASPALCRPLELGADLVCESATKFLGGHHDVTAGVLAGSRELVARAHRHQLDTGASMDPFAAYLLHRGVKTLALRVERQTENALAVARFLAGHPKVATVRYVGLESDPAHALALRLLDGFGGILAFEVPGGREAAERTMDSLRLILRATSLGGVETVVSHPASTSHRQLSADQLAAAGISQGLLRLSVGCEDADDLLADLSDALGSV